MYEVYDLVIENGERVEVPDKVLHCLHSRYFCLSWDLKYGALFQGELSVRQC